MGIIVLIVVASVLVIAVIVTLLFKFVQYRGAHAYHKNAKEAMRSWRLAKSKSARIYWFNQTTGETKWDPPEGFFDETLPPGWHEDKAEDGEVYYWHDDGESTSWDRPDWIPRGWIPPDSYFESESWLNGGVDKNFDK